MVDKAGKQKTVFTLSVDCDSSAFADINLEAELQRIIAQVADRIGNGESSGIAYDSNGNNVASFFLETIYRVS